MPATSPYKKIGELVGERSIKVHPSGVREYERVYRVILQDCTDPNGVVIQGSKIGPAEVLFAPGLPDYGDRWELPYYDANGNLAGVREFDDGARMLRVEPKQTVDPYIWLARYFYTSELQRFLSPAANPFKFFPKPIPGGAGVKAGDVSESSPEFQPPEVDWDIVFYEEDQLYDLDDKAIVNSAGQHFADGGMTKMIPTLVLNYTRNVLVYDPLRSMEYSNTINLKKFYGFDPHTVLLKKITGKLVTGKFLHYFREHFEFHFRKTFDKWHPYKRLDAGYYTLNKTTGVLSPCVDSSGNIVLRLLDGNGQQLAMANFDPSTDPVYLDFTKYEEKDWDPLQL